MKIERTKNAIRNIFFGGVLRVYHIFALFFIRTAMIRFMGVEYLGLNSLFISILQVLSLAELGVGSAMVYSMYRPIAEDNKKEICALMSLYRDYYRIIGLVIAIIGLIILPFIPKLINGDIPSQVNIYILYLLNLTATVSSYWMYAYKNSLLMACQRVDIISKITLITNTIQYILQFFVICFLKNYYIYLITVVLFQLITNIVIAIVTTKKYPQYKAKGKIAPKIRKGINHRIRDLFTAKLGGVIINSADTIVISAFLGLTMLAVYQNYFYILNSIIGFVTIIFTACTAGIGNSIIVETKEKNYRDLKNMTFIISWMAGFCTCCLLCLYQPFMKLWVGRDLELSFSVIICLCIYYFIYEINHLLNTYKDAAGIWHEDRFRPLITALANLIMNLIMVQFWGIYGVILSTVLSMIFIGMPWLLYNLFTVLFEPSQVKDYLKHLFFYAGNSFIVCVFTYTICNLIHLDDWMTLLVRTVICCIVPNVVFLIVYHKKIEFKQSIQIVDDMTKGKLALFKKLVK